MYGATAAETDTITLYLDAISWARENRVSFQETRRTSHRKGAREGDRTDPTCTHRPTANSFKTGACQDNRFHACYPLAGIS